MNRCGWVTVGVGALLAFAPASAQFTADELARRPAIEEFLNTAEVTNAVQMSRSEGVTRPYRLTLTNGGESHDALWKDVKGRTGGYWEGWKYEIAAYELDKYLDLDMVPATVEREYRGKAGSCQQWVTFWMNMRDMAKDEINPPSEKVRQWNRSIYLQRAFDNLIANVDRHLGNILLTEDWRMILIDHSRAFQPGKRHTKRLIFGEKHPEGPKIMRQLPREFVERIKALDTEKLRGIVGDYLTDTEVGAVLARRDLMLTEINGLIAKNGEDKVLY